MRIPVALGLVLLLALSTLAAPDRDAHAATFTVTRTDDPTPDGCLPADCSLREAIIDANASPSADTITLPAGTYALSLTNASEFGEDASLTGDLDITDSLTITGAGAANTIIDANDIDRVVQVAEFIDVTIAGITITDGYHGVGAGVYSQGALTITDSVITDNTQDEVGYGAGIANDPGGNLTLRDSEISNNVAQQFGAGVANSLGAPMLLERVTVSGNSSSFGAGGGIFNKGSATVRESLIESNSGGAIYNTGSAAVEMTVERTTVRANGDTIFSAILNEDQANMTILDSSVVDNTASLGGILSGGELTVDGSTVSGHMFAGIVVSAPGGAKTIRNTTISGNSGSGLYVDDTDVSLNNVTITENPAADGGGLNSMNDGAVTVSNTIIAGNTDDSGGEAPDCSGTITSLGHNIIGSTDGCTITGDTTGNITGVDPMLGALADNGGPTFTHAPMIGSPAIDAGSPAAPGSGIGTCE